MSVMDTIRCTIVSFSWLAMLPMRTMELARQKVPEKTLEEQVIEYYNKKKLREIIVLFDQQQLESERNKIRDCLLADNKLQEYSKELKKNKEKKSLEQLITLFSLEEQSDFESLASSYKTEKIKLQKMLDELIENEVDNLHITHNLAGIIDFHDEQSSQENKSKIKEYFRKHYLADYLSDAKALNNTSYLEIILVLYTPVELKSKKEPKEKSIDSDVVVRLRIRNVINEIHQRSKN